MTHKQKAIEALNKLHGLIDVVADAMTPDEYRTMYDTLADLREHVTLMEQVGNPAARCSPIDDLNAVGERLAAERRASDYFGLAASLMRREAEASCALDGETMCEADLVAPAPITARCNPIRMDAEEEPVLWCQSCRRNDMHCRGIDVDGHMKCESCGGTELRVRR